MIIGNIDDTAIIETLHPQFAMAFQWIRSHGFDAHKLTNTKRVNINGDRLFVNIDTATLKSKYEQILEVHRKYIDIHVPINATEIIGWKRTDLLTELIEGYDETLDRAFYGDTPKAYYTLNPGDFCIMFPQDAHAPIIGSGEINKLCFKIMV
ncbi:MAG: YhcH/YjgK/YiaL family protein [Muribaculaceae bacterium]